MIVLLLAIVLVTASATAHGQATEPAKPQDLAPLQRPSRPMIEVAQQHYQAGERFLSSVDCLRLSRRCSRRHGSPRARVAVVTLVPP